MSGRPAWIGPRKLQARIFVWLLGAIVVALAASAVSTVITRTESPSELSTRVLSRHVRRRLAKTWDDPRAVDRYVQELRETTGLDLKVRRDSPIEADGRARRSRGGDMFFEGGVAIFPVVKDGVTVGALELTTEAPRPRLSGLVLALGVALVALGFAARRVSTDLARPLERVARAVGRFGAGDLKARSGIDDASQRWVAEEVRAVGHAFDDMADRIERVLTDQRELLAAISHELRSPLGRARVALEISRDHLEPEVEAGLAQGVRSRERAARRGLDDADRQLIEIDAILGDLLASARAGLGDLRLGRERLGPWLRARAASEETGPVEVHLTSEAEERSVALDGALLGRALHNLFANAWAHGHPRELPLVVMVTLTGGRARIVVRDRGPGFPEDLLPRAFEPFVMGRDPARSKPRPKDAATRASASAPHGLGLGLSLVRRIVEAHGGIVSAANVVEDGRLAGAEITIELDTVLT